MCTLPAGATLSEKEFENCWESNSDGGGYSICTPKGLLTRKSTKLDEFKEMWKKDSIEYGSQYSRLIHFRNSTGGLKTEFNCHPFAVRKGLVMAHNGVINIEIPEGEKDKSDTHVFVDHVLKKLPRWWDKNDAMVRLISRYIGGGSKLAFLDDTGEFMIFNKSAGVTDNNRWFSNDMYKSKRVVTSSYSGSSSYYGYSANSFYFANQRWQICGCCSCIVPWSETRKYGDVEFCKTCVSFHEYFTKRGAAYKAATDACMDMMACHFREIIPPSWDKFTTLYYNVNKKLTEDGKEMLPYPLDKHGKILPKYKEPQWQKPKDDEEYNMHMFGAYGGV